MGLNYEQAIELVKVLAEMDLLLIDTGEDFAECDIEIRRKKKKDGKEVVIFIASPRK